MTKEQKKLRDYLQELYASEVWACEMALKRLEVASAGLLELDDSSPPGEVARLMTAVTKHASWFGNLDICFELLKQVTEAYPELGKSKTPAAVE
jgi:hypothetical protein